MKVFPHYSAIDFENEKHRVEIAHWSNAVYLIFCFATIGGLWLSVFLTIDISVSSPGLIRPAAEITSIRAPVSGRIKELSIHENKLVREGDVLYSIESETYDSKEMYLEERGEELKRFINDLEVLTSQGVSIKNLRTSLFRQAAITYQQQLIESIRRYEKMRLEFNRNQILHKQQVIADSEFEDFQFKLDQAERAVTLLKQTQISQWQSQLSSHVAELLRIESDRVQLVKERGNLIIKSPVTGSAQNLAGIYQRESCLSQSGVSTDISGYKPYC